MENKEKFNPRLVSGKDFYEVVSAFQKFVRRGMEHEALWCATELSISGYEEYVWRRIKVMVSEDIGVGMISLPAQIDALYTTYTAMKKEKNHHKPEKLPFIHALMLIIRSKKSRLVDNKCWYYFGLRDMISPVEIPDWIHDCHTRKGKAMGRGNDYFFEHSAKIENEAGLPDEFPFRDFVIEVGKKFDERKGQVKKEAEEVKSVTEPTLNFDDTDSQ